MVGFRFAYYAFLGGMGIVCVWFVTDYWVWFGFILWFTFSVCFYCWLCCLFDYFSVVIGVLVYGSELFYVVVVCLSFWVEFFSLCFVFESFFWFAFELPIGLMLVVCIGF